VCTCKNDNVPVDRAHDTVSKIGGASWEDKMGTRVGAGGSGGGVGVLAVHCRS
jgi:hypothetical protein